MNSDKFNGANEKSRAIDIARENVELRGGVSMKGSETRRGVDGSAANIKQTALLTLWIRLFAFAAYAAVLSRCHLGIADRCMGKDREGKKGKEGRGFA